ncbi:hypothetical protein SUGI_0909950 [Cryptomeria japonica]|uniref:subtilisin-like protease SBT1.7 n=1 Tax=Cryptomeria japonica TaxID=3369 RepID=UPI00241468F7|nr:subtilisin-like protease SBT1.7 [Cryptomeria japonica]GLJ43702.1 hypothetical protein SUGI_0909950 [Cryptomeria japonica]
MAKWAALWILAFAFAAAANGEPVEKKTYIVHMAQWQMPESYATHEHWHTSMAENLSAELLYHYNQVFHGFAARMTAAQAETLKKSHGVLSVYEETVSELHTTHTPDFLGLSSNAGLWPESEFGDDIIVGVLDTGVSPESESFDDKGFGPVRGKWKGECAGGENFKCSQKLIGARFYRRGSDGSGNNNEAQSARDTEGHGTHTSSTAAGGFVRNASIFGYASGTARGMAAQARIAAYKVCWGNGCYDSDILAAMDQAVADGVDVLSLSLGGTVGAYYRDSIAIGAFGATENGVFVSCSAGNSGPGSFTLSNVAPWIMTVGASTLDRDFPAYAILGDEKWYRGVSLSAGSRLPKGMLDLVYAGNVSANGSQQSNLCMSGTLDRKLVKGKIVLCDRGVNARVEKGAVVKAAGGLAMILANSDDEGAELVADAHLLPATTVSAKDGNTIKEYIFSTKSPKATIGFNGTILGVKPAPAMAAFSSRGPSSVTPQILKPDITAPGVNILAAWTPNAGPTGLSSDNRRVPFNIISGTSMSCPHVSGLAALLKAANPDWSPAAIKSALMTTAYSTDNAGHPILDIATGNPSTPFDHGAGHADPQTALHPGLVYDLTAEDYLHFLCSINYTDYQIKILARRNFTCPGNNPITFPEKLNYPSFVVIFTSPVVELTRTVTNVGPAGSTYKFSVSLPATVAAEVEPATLSFSETGEKRSYTVKFTSKSNSADWTFGSLTWTDGKHSVRSPIAITSEIPLEKRQGRLRASH